MPVPTTASDLKGLAASRLGEAKILHASGYYAGAWYLAGYSVEFALKAVVCKTLGVSDYPETVFRGSLKSHLPAELIILSGLTAELSIRLKDVVFSQYWALVTAWSVQDRYGAKRTQQEVDNFLEALEEPQNGVFVWLSSRW